MTQNQEAKKAGAGSLMRMDLQVIVDQIEPGSRVLDIGCGDGALLDHLVHRKQVIGRGMELSQAGVNACVSNGLSVVQGDADRDLFEYPTDAFDYAVLSKTLQATREPHRVLEELVRIGRHAIVSFPNFGYWRIRLQLLTTGHMPVTRALPDPWFTTENIHLCTIRDFVDLTDACKVRIERSFMVNNQRRTAKEITNLWEANLFGQDAVFILSAA